jgi:AcrR family transcriptional regulator
MSGSMTDTASTGLATGQILDAAENVLRRYGPAKANVVDVARALGVSHGSVYRHYANKAELRDAVARRWLSRVSEPLAEIVESNSPAPIRLRRWITELSRAKRRMAQDDPELFDTYARIVAASRDVVADHLQILASQIGRVISDGAAAGDFEVADTETAARAVLQATACFHHPAHAAEWREPAVEDDLNEVVSLLLRGLQFCPAEVRAGSSR